MQEPTQHLCNQWESHFSNVRIDRMSPQFIHDFQEHRIFCPVCKQVEINQYIMRQSLSYVSLEKKAPNDLLDPLLELLSDEKYQKEELSDAAHEIDQSEIGLVQLPDISGVPHCYVGYFLTAVNVISHTERLAMQGLFLARFSFLHQSFPGISFSLQLKNLYLPAGEGEESLAATVLLFRFTDWRYSGSELKRKALAWNQQIMQLLGSSMSDYRFTPVPDDDSLRELLEPFEVLDVAEIRRTAFLQNAIPTIFGGIPDCETLMDLIMGQTNAIEMSVTIEPAELQQFLNSLDNQGISNAMDARSYAPITSLQMSERVGSAMMNSAIELSQYEGFLQRVQSLRTHAFAVRIHIASNQRIPDALLATLNSEFGGPSKLLAQSVWQSSINATVSTSLYVRPRSYLEEGENIEQFSQSVENNRKLTTTPWESDPNTVYLCDLGEVARLMNLPISPSWIYERGIALALPFNEEEQEGIRLGINKHHNKIRRVVQPFESRIKHTWIIGQTGTGKSTLLENMIQQDIERGSGVIVIDPHGEMLENVIGRIPRNRKDDVIYFDPADSEMPMGINIIQARTEEEKALVVSSMIQMIQKLFDPNYIGIVGPRFEHNVRNAMLSILSVPEGATLIELVRILTDDAYMKTVLPYITDPIVKRYWTDQIAHTSDYHRSEVLDWLVSKFSRFVTDPAIRRIIGQVQSSFDFREAMDQGKIVLLSLAKGKIGSANANFLGLTLLPMILQAALSRANITPSLRRECTLYIDEFHNYATESLALMLAEARKYKLSLVLANQHLRQLTDDVRDALYGNAGNIISLRVGAADAEILQRLLEPSPISATALMNLPDYTAYARILINNRRSPAFVLNTELSSVPADPIVAEQIRLLSRSKYGRRKEDVDKEILKRSNMG